MFKLLKDKLKSWLGKPEDKKVNEKKAKPKDKAKKQTKIKKPSKKSTKQTAVEETPVVTQAQVSAQETEVQEEKPGTQKKGFFSSIIDRFTTNKITQEQVEEIFSELEIILLESNVALDVVDKIKENLIKDLVDQDVKSKDLRKKILDSIKKAIGDVLVNSPDLINEIKKHEGTYTILFFGINGTGKTTTIAKIANLLKKHNISCVLAAADTFRAAAIEQLETHANKLNVPIIKGEYSTDPTSIAFDAKSYAEKNRIKCLLIDTAGRMYTKENLIKQMEKLIRVIKPDKKIFVGESTTGNDMLEQIKTFNEALGIDGIILSKADIDEKGGTALSVSYMTNKPIYFLGTGQAYDDLKEFKKEDIIKSLGLD